MSVRLWASAFLLVFWCALNGCGAQRKLSRVEVRVPAAARGSNVLSPLRQRILAQKEFPKACPAEVRELFSTLAPLRVKFPPCPERLVLALEVARPALGVEEMSSLEELSAAQCRPRGQDSFGEGLGSLLDRRDPTAEGMGESKQKLRASLREALLEWRVGYDPLEQWVRRYGDFVIPEEPLAFLDQVVNRPTCRLTDQEVDQSYRTLRSLEEFARLQGEQDPQRAQLVRFLAGVQRVIDLKIREFFHP